MVREDLAIEQTTRHSAGGGWQRFHTNPHVRAEFGAVMFLLAALATHEVGLWISPVVCTVIAIAIVGMDIGDWLHERH